MSDKTSSPCFQKHVEIADGFKKRTMSLSWKPSFGGSMKEGIELFCAFCWIVMLLGIESGSLFLYFFLLFKGGLFGLMFCIWYATYFYRDRNAAETGSHGQGSEKVRTFALYRHFTNYFPVSIVKTAELPPDRNYLFGTYPHGIISVGAFCNFGTSNTKFRELFPGIRSKLCTLNYHFFVPFYRDLALGYGMISAKFEGIYNALSQSNNKLAVCNYDGYTSNAVCLVVGGAQEAMYARPGNYRLVMNKRKGFVKIAIQTGASLVPVFSFGEIDIFDQPDNSPGTKTRAYQEFVKKWTGVAPVNFFGRGFSEKSFGLIPHRRPITTVVGAPIDVKKNPKPTLEEINEYHGKFIEAMNKLFEDHKAKYIKDSENVKLIIE